MKRRIIPFGSAPMAACGGFRPPPPNLPQTCRTPTQPPGAPRCSQDASIGPSRGCRRLLGGYWTPTHRRPWSFSPGSFWEFLGVSGSFWTPTNRPADSLAKPGVSGSFWTPTNCPAAGLAKGSFWGVSGQGVSGHPPIAGRLASPRLRRECCRLARGSFWTPTNRRPSGLASEPRHRRIRQRPSPPRGVSGHPPIAGRWGVSGHPPIAPRPASPRGVSGEFLDREFLDTHQLPGGRPRQDFASGEFLDTHQLPSGRPRQDFAPNAAAQPANRGTAESAIWPSPPCEVGGCPQIP